MNNSVRMAAGAVLGVIVGGLVVFAVEAVGHTMFPPPAGTDLSNPEAMRSLIASLPMGALVMVLVGWFLGSLAGAYVARRVGRSDLAAWIVAVVFVALTAANFAMIPHPLWMMAAGVVVPFVSAWLVMHMGRSARSV